MTGAGIEKLQWCDTYWGSHGCDLPKGHDGPRICDCALMDNGEYHPDTRTYYDEPGVVNVGAPPCYGPETHFYGDDIPEATREAVHTPRKGDVR